MIVVEWVYDGWPPGVVFVGTGGWPPGVAAVGWGWPPLVGLVIALLLSGMSPP